MKISPALTPVRIALPYAVFGMAWIAFSDRVLVWLALSPEAMLTAQTWKGWAFVAVSAAIIYLLSRAALQATVDKLRSHRAAEEHYRMLFGENPMPMYVYDLETLAFLDANDAARRLLGPLPPTVREAICAEDRPRFDEMKDALGPDPRPRTGRWRLNGQDGIVYVDIDSTTIEVDGRAARLALLTDVTAQVAAEAALLDTAGQLERRNAEIAELSQAAAHDLQHPLRNVVSHLQLLERRLGAALDSESRQFLTFAVDASLRMKTLVDDILQYTGIECDDPAPTDVGAVIDDVLAGMAAQLSAAGATVTVLPPMPTVWARRRHLVMVVNHLLDNAIKFRHPDRAPQIAVSAAQIGRSWEFRFADNGIGIPPENLLDVFAVFRRLHRTQATGNGIGLALCKKIIEQHGGTIRVESTVGEGCTFVFTLPAS